MRLTITNMHSDLRYSACFLWLVHYLYHVIPLFHITVLSCTIQGEIKTILDLGGLPEKIMYSNPIKMLSHIQYAAENNVRMMAFDSEPELPRIKSYFPTAQ